MLLKSKESDSLIEILDITALVDPSKPSIPGQNQAGQEEQQPQTYDKASLLFPSGEKLPQCWINANYQLQ